MEINLNSNAIKWGVGIETMGSSQTSDIAPGADVARPAFTITNSVASPEDISAATIPDEALLRDDDLGKLVNAAFDLPPPPMPAFVS